MIWKSLNEHWRKVVKLSIISFVILFCYIFLFAVDANDNQFLITGGAIGFVSSVRRLLLLSLYLQLLILDC